MYILYTAELFLLDLRRGQADGRAAEGEAVLDGGTAGAACGG